MNDTSANQTSNRQYTPVPLELAPADFYDPVIEAYKKDVDRTLLRENLKLSVQERLEQLENFVDFARELQAAGRKARSKS